MRQQTLTEFDPSYASSDPRDLQAGKVFFKTKDGKTHKGECFKNNIGCYFESKKRDYSPFEVESFHPVKVDI